MRLSINHADHIRSGIQVSFVKEKFTVFYEMKDAGGAGPANWAEKEVKVKAGEKNAGYLFEEKGGLIVGEPEDCRFVTVEAESAEEAAQALRAFYGAGINPQPGLGCKTSSLSEVKLQS